MEEIFVDEKEGASAERKKSIATAPLDSRTSRPLFSPSMGEHAVSNIKKWRLAKLEDVERIHHCQIKQTQIIFGDVDLKMLQTLSLYTFAYENIVGEIIGYFGINSYPNIAALLPEVWIYWMKIHYELTTISYENTFFIHYLVWDIRYNTELLKSQFEQLFLANPKLEHICIVLPANCTIPSEYLRLFDTIFSREWPLNHRKLKSPQSLYIYHRSQTLPAFRLRKAIPEDNDDLLGILHYTHPEFVKMYGEYYIAKTLLKKDKNIVIIVANIGVQIKGFIWLTSSVDLEKVNKNFNIFPFQFLRKVGPNNRIVKKKYKEIIRKYIKTYFENISASNSKEDLYKYIIQDEDAEEYEKDSQDGSEIKLFQTTESLHRCHQPNYVSVKQPQPPANYIDWLEIKQRLKYYADCYKYQKTSVQETDNPPNAFAIQLIAMHPDLDSRLSFEMLVAAFDAFPDKSYCLLSLPTDKFNPPILKHFTKVTPRPDCHLRESLYVAHKNFIRGRTTVARVKGCDLKDIKCMLKYGTYQEIQPAREIMHFIRHSLISHERKYDALAVKNENKIIGIIIITIAKDISLFRKYYRLDDYACFKNLYLPQLHGKILYMYVTPILEGLATNIFTDIYRITGYHSLYYTFQEPNLVHSYNNLVKQMYPIRPRRVLPDITVQDVPNPPEELKPYALFYHNINLVKEVRSNVDLKIVFIGFTRATKAFLEHIIFQKGIQKLRFTNLTVVAQPGIFEADYADMKVQTHLLWMIPKYSQNYLARLGFMIWVNFVSGQLRQINREEKYITIDKGKILKYDYLYFFENWEFGIPTDVPKTQVTEPLNFQSVNTNFDCHCLHYKVIAMKKCMRNDISIIVYGDITRAYSCVNYLLVSGISPNNIHFVTQIPRKGKYNSEFSPFYDDYINKRVTDELEKTKINIYRGYKFQKWVRDETDMITKICFVSKFEAIWLNCSFFISYTLKKISRTSFEVEGCPVIDANFQTNDPFIFSCGAATKYRRSLYAHMYKHTYYNHHEIAEYLAQKAIDRILPKVEKTSKPNLLGTHTYKPRCNANVPIFEKPIIKSFYLPGNLFLTTLREPGMRIAMKLQELCGHNNGDLITINKPLSTAGESESDIESYCRIHMDKNGFIRDITCLTKGSKNLEYIYRLYGLHESLLGNMKARYEAGEIEDFLQFFQNPWIVTITDDRFKIFLNNTKSVEETALHLIPEMNHLLQQVGEGKKLSLTETERNTIKWYVNNKFRHLIERQLFEYMSKDEEKFNMFTTPDMVRNELVKYENLYNNNSNNNNNI